MEKKLISVVVPCYNEEQNVIPLSEAILELFKEQLSNYELELLFIDNNSKDKTREYIREICKKNKCVKAIFNAKNFGQFNSPYYALTQASGDCAILVCADFQDPLEMLPKFIEEWENDYKVVIGTKSKSKTNKFIHFLRGVYYKVIKKFSNVEQIEHFTGFGLYDRCFLEVLKKLDDPTPFLRGIVGEYGIKVKEVPYTQEKRKAGKTKNNFASLYDASMLSVTSYTKVGLRVATFIGFFVSMLSFIVGIAYLILKLCYWNRFSAGTIPILLAVLFIGGVQLIFTGVMGEYIMAINKRVMKRPLVVEEERINFKNKKDKDDK